MALCRALKREAGLRSPVLFLTARGALADKLEAFDAGAVDYMVKPFAPAELLARARAIVAHAPATGGAQLRVGDYVLDLQGHLLRHGEAVQPLHATGLVLLRSLMEASPGCVSREELCALLWQDGPPGSDPLRMHVYQLRRQFGHRFGRPLIATMRGVGYRFTGVDE
ncbi:response regulator transcription factor [Pseudoxanthomonas sp. NC8]|nr:response regulator transcription factor [Pseudoxanthomonas sp. NC8]